MIELMTAIPDILDVEKMGPVEAVKFYLVDPFSRRELAFVKSADCITGIVEFYKTIQCTPDDPECVKYSHYPICRKFVEFIVDKEGVLRCPTYKKQRDFDVMDRTTGAILRQVRTTI